MLFRRQDGVLPSCLGVLKLFSILYHMAYMGLIRDTRYRVHHSIQSASHNLLLYFVPLSVRLLYLLITLAMTDAEIGLNVDRSTDIPIATATALP
jgi:hypothetical protein